MSHQESSKIQDVFTDLSEFHGFHDVFSITGPEFRGVFLASRTGSLVFFAPKVQAFRRKGKLYLVFEFVEKSMLDILEVRKPEVLAAWGSWRPKKKAPEMEKREKDRKDARKKTLFVYKGNSIVNYCICIICIIMYLGLSKNGFLLSAINQSFPHIAHFNCHLMGYIRYIPTTGIPIRGC